MAIAKTTEVGVADYPRTQGVIATVGMYGGGERFQCVMPFVYKVGPPSKAVYGDFLDYFESDIFPLWILCLGADMEIVGWQIEAMTNGWCVPGRKNYASGTFVGQVGGDSYSQNVSMLLKWNSSSQLAAGPRVITGHTFIGPPPEANCVNRVIDAGFVAGALQDLATDLGLGMVGTTSGARFVKALSKTSHGSNRCWEADLGQVLPTVYTQKRRLNPII